VDKLLLKAWRRMSPDLAHGPWRLGSFDWLTSAVRMVRAAKEDDYGTAASAIAFASFLALLPMLGAVALTYGMVTSPDRVVADIRSLIFILPIDARQFIGDWLIRSITRSEGREAGLLIAIAIALFSAMRAGRTIMRALNTASEVETRRGFVRRQTVALAIVFAGAVLVLGSLFVIASLTWVERVLPIGLAGVLRGIFWPPAIGGAAASLTLVYRYTPNWSPPPWRWIFPGALFATILWLLATLGFGWYVSHFGRTELTYGSVGAIVVLQLWLFLSAYVMLLGAKLNTELMRCAGMHANSEARL